MATPGPEEERGRRRAQHFVSVAIRVRPIYGPDEPIAIWAKPPEHGEGQRRVCVNRGYIMEEYEFSRVFGPEDDNCELFRTLQGPAVTASVFSGVNETLFAYGQTGSGKTHTIFGTREDSGLLQLFVRAIFDQAEVSPGSTVHACCYEVLGDSLTDLISPEPLLEGGQLREEDIVYDEMFIKTQKCRYQIVRVGNVSTCLSLLQDARANRTAGISSCNATSSRSHAIVHLFVQNPAAASARAAAGRVGNISSSIGALTLVDLAGTEKEHENPSEQGRKSARLLNTSLSSLNRLLRRLQTGGLDESERRQSVLNKCLWEYLRPGCGISLIFCVNPVLRHRAITLSTLAMATDSKLIHSQRKAQYIQLPAAAPQEPRAVPQLPQFGASSPSTAARPPRPGTPSQASAPAEERTPRGGSTPNRTPTARGGGNRGRTPDFCMTPQTAPGVAERPAAVERPAGSASPGGASRRPGQGQRADGEPLTSEELERLCGYDLRSPVAVRSLALQNTKLRRKLSRSRARSQERIVQAERERDALGLENTALQHECESLRALFLRQQQQQIAFWTGPFMEMIAPRESHASLAASIRSSGSGAEPGPGSAAEASSAAGTPPASASTTPAASSAAASSAAALGGVAGRSAAAMSAAAGLLSAEEAREECIRSLRRERDYWRLLATDLKREVRGRLPPRSSHKGSRGEGSDLSTSQSQQEGSEPSRTPWSGSDSGSEISADPFAVEV